MIHLVFNTRRKNKVSYGVLFWTPKQEIQCITAKGIERLLFLECCNDRTKKQQSMTFPGFQCIRYFILHISRFIDSNWSQEWGKLTVSLYLAVASKHDCVVFRASWLAANINLSLPLISPFNNHQRYYWVCYILRCHGRIITANINKSIGFVLLTTLNVISDWLVSLRLPPF